MNLKTLEPTCLASLLKNFLLINVEVTVMIMYENYNLLKAGLHPFFFKALSVLS